MVTKKDTVVRLVDEHSYSSDRTLYIMLIIYADVTIDPVVVYCYNAGNGYVKIFKSYSDWQAFNWLDEEYKSIDLALDTWDDDEDMEGFWDGSVFKKFKNITNG